MGLRTWAAAAALLWASQANAATINLTASNVYINGPELDIGDEGSFTSRLLTIPGRHGFHRVFGYFPFRIGPDEAFNFTIPINAVRSQLVVWVYGAYGTDRRYEHETLSFEVKDAYDPLARAITGSLRFGADTYWTGLSVTYDDDAPTSYTGTFTVSAAIPEPSTWAMMVIGFVGLSFAARRHAAQARAVG